MIIKIYINTIITTVDPHGVMDSLKRKIGEPSSNSSCSSVYSLACKGMNLPHFPPAMGREQEGMRLGKEKRNSKTSLVSVETC